MSTPLKKITIKGFKSIRELVDFELGSINILIGANGSGKSNFIDFFRLLNALVEENLQGFVRQNDGGDTYLYRGPKYTQHISSRLVFGDNIYEFDLATSSGAHIYIFDERVQYTGGFQLGTLKSIGQSLDESNLKTKSNDPATSPWGIGGGPCSFVYRAMSNWVVYHFHDTTPESTLRRPGESQGFAQLSPNGSNLASFLHGLKFGKPSSYNRIRDVVNLMAPFIDDFHLEPEKFGNSEKIRLRWKQKGVIEPFLPTQLSDGTLRFICLATALLQPNPPSTILIDEPELGLHPFALELFANLVSEVSMRTQIIVSTQAPALLNNFEPNEIVVVDRKDGESAFNRLDSDSLKSWLEDYTLGELWQKNIFEGTPAYE